MARLPTADDLGPRPVPRSTQPITTTNPGIAEKAIAESIEADQAMLTGVTDRFAQVAQRIRTREDAVERARAFSAYNEAAANELRRVQTEGDLSSLDTTKAYGAFLREQQEKILGAHRGSPDSRASLQARLEGVRASYANQAGQMGLEAQQNLVLSTMANNLRPLTATAYDKPDTISDLWATLDAQIDDMAPALTPEQEAEHRSLGRREIVLSALESHLDRGAWREARRIVDETPGLIEVLSPEQQRSLEGRFADAVRAEQEARTAGLAKVREAQNILGRDLTAVERVRLAGLESPKGEQTPADKIRALESVLGPLSLEQKSRVLGVDPQTAQTDAGKMVQDREMFVRQYGEDSPQVQAFDEAAALQDEPPSLSDIGGIRKEFTSQSKDFVQVRDAYNRIAEVSANPSAAGDLALIFNFMKMLDPGSTVREGEFANAQNSAGVPERIRGAYNRVISGERLTVDQRSDFLGQSENLMRAQLRTQVSLEDQYRNIARRAGLEESNDVVTPDYIGPLRSMFSGGDNAKAAPSGNIIHLDLEGNVISGGQQSKAPQEGESSAEPDKADEVDAADKPIAEMSATQIYDLLQAGGLTDEQIEEIDKRLTELGA